MVCVTQPTYYTGCELNLAATVHGAGSRARLLQRYEAAGALLSGTSRTCKHATLFMQQDHIICIDQHWHTDRLPAAILYPCSCLCLCPALPTLDGLQACRSNDSLVSQPSPLLVGISGVRSFCILPTLCNPYIATISAIRSQVLGTCMTKQSSKQHV